MGDATPERAAVPWPISHAPLQPWALEPRCEPAPFGRVGFLLNHEGAHQVAHAMPIALAMSAAYPDVRVEVFVAAGAAEAEARRFAAAANSRIAITTLKGAGWVGRAVSALTGDCVPGERVSILSRNRGSFSALDALVVPEKTSLMLKSHFGLSDLPLIHTRHGAGDRAIGFDKASGRFDFILLSGEKVLHRLKDLGHLQPDRFAIVGYPKFDQLATPQPRRRIFDNARPTVLYNPHASPCLSSWYLQGPEILEFFARQTRFNLIFAPHVMLFAKRYQASLSPPGISRVPPVPGHIAKLPHIHVDLGSPASVDMTYTRLADIYLGDASSQVYEFLATPRPCIFVNARDLAWKGNANFMHWTTGPVVSDLAGLERALDEAQARPGSYREVQERLFAYTFDMTPELSAQRAARAIIGWLKQRH